jgi:hypothetical protein
MYNVSRDLGRDARRVDRQGLGKQTGNSRPRSSTQGRCTVRQTSCSKDWTRTARFIL